MRYSELCEIYEDLEQNSSRLKKTEILSNLLKKLKETDYELIYLLKGQVFPDYSEKEFGISEKLCIRVMEKSSGISKETIIKEWRQLGDLGLVAEKIINSKKQNTLFTKKLTVKKVIENLKKLPSLEGRGTIERKLAIISELLTSASGKEAKYLIRTLIGNLRIGVASGTMRDSIVHAIFNPKSIEEKKKYSEIVQRAYDRSTDILVVFEKAKEGISALKKIKLTPGHPVKVMLAQKANSIEDGFKRCGRPAVFEYKYDGFRMLINKTEKGEIKIFTRRLDEVTKQFPDVVKYIEDYFSAKSFILDAEAIGYDPKTKKYKPFEAISQRIRRKHDIDRLIKELPIELNAFDILYLNGKSLVDSPFGERSKILRKLIRPHKYKFRYSKQIITSDEKEAEKFYKEALKDGQEGVMIKNLNSPYKPGSRVGHMLKFKPDENELDLVITSAEYGKGKRVGVFSSFTLSCRNKENKLVEIGKASTGLKEKEELGLSYKELTNKINPLIIKEHGRKVDVEPKIIVTIIYQNIQRSPTYSSGFALRFPRITKLREDKGVNDIATIDEIGKDYQRHELKIHY